MEEIGKAKNQLDALTVKYQNILKSLLEAFNKSSQKLYQVFKSAKPDLKPGRS